MAIQQRIQRILAAIIALFLVFLMGLLTGLMWRPAPKAESRTVSGQTILTALRSQGFLVTRTYLFDQPVTITKSTGSAFKDFFVGQTIDARGTMEVNLGIDLTNLDEQDVAHEENAVTVRIPRVSLFNTRLVGPIDVRNTQGVLKRITDPNDGYNEALAELTRSAEAAAQEPAIIENAEQASQEEIRRLVLLLFPGADVRIEWQAAE